MKNLFLILVVSLMLPLLGRADFTARAVKVEDGTTHLAFPTEPGWFYQVEVSNDCQTWEPAPGGIFYGDGQEKHFFMMDAPPPAPPVVPSGGPPPAPLPPKPFHLYFYDVFANHQSSLLASFFNPGEWRWEMSDVFPHDQSRMTTLRVEETDARYSLDVMLFSYGTQALPPVPPDQTWNPEAIKIRDLFLAHRSEIIGQFAALAALPPQPPPPELPGGGRAFFRVWQKEIDTNLNTLFDWWELQNGYSAFALVGETGHADANGDDDGDGSTNAQEQAGGTDPHNSDSDGDGVVDGQDSDPKNKSYHPPSLHFYTRTLNFDDQVISGNHQVTLTGSADWDAALHPTDVLTGELQRVALAGQLMGLVPYLNQPMAEWKTARSQLLQSLVVDPTSSFITGGPTSVLRHSKMWLVEKPARSTRTDYYRGGSPGMWAAITKTGVRLIARRTDAENPFTVESLVNVPLTLEKGETKSSPEVNEVSFYGTSGREEFACYAGFPEIVEKRLESGVDTVERYFPEHNIDAPWVMVPRGNVGYATVLWKDLPPVAFTLSSPAPGMHIVPDTFPTTPASTEINIHADSAADELEGTTSKLEMQTPVGKAKILNIYPAKEIVVKVKVWDITMYSDDEDPGTIPPGTGAPYRVCIKRKPGSGILFTTAATGDTLNNLGEITTGPDGICQTKADDHDEQVIDVGNGAKDEPFLNPGVNGRINTKPSGDDGVSGEQLTTGPDGKRQTPQLFGGTIPNTTDPMNLGIQDYLNEVYGKQMNVRFEVTFGAGTITPEVKPSAPADALNSGALAPTRVGLNGTFDLWMGLKEFTSEELLLEDAGLEDPAALMNIYFIPVRLRAVDATSPLADSDDRPIGFSRLIKKHLRAYVTTADQPANDPDFPYAVAHEIGHLGGLNHCHQLFGYNEVNGVIKPIALPLIKGFPGLTGPMDRRRLMNGIGELNDRDPATGRRYVRLIKHEWETFRKSILEAQKP